MSREEHLLQCKQRALKYLERGDVKEAVTSMLSDLSKHPDNDPPLTLVQLGMITIMSNNIAEARRFIEGFN